MRTLNGYLRRMLWVHFAIALASLLAIFSVINLTEELEAVGTGSYTVSDALRFVVLTLPAEAYELFAATALLGGVTGLGSLAAHNEIVALWSARISPATLVWLVLRNAAWIALAGVLLGELVVPPLAQRAYRERSVQMSSGAALHGANGFWMREGDRFLNVRTPMPGGRLRDLYLFDFDAGGRLQRFTHAERADWEGSRWMLRDVTERHLGEEGVTVGHLREVALESLLNPRRLQALLLPPESLSSPEIWASLRSLRARGENPNRYEHALWKRIVTPFSTVVMIFLSLPFVLGVFDAGHLGRRIVAGALAGIGYQLGTQTLARAGLVYGMSPALTTLLPTLLALACGGWLFRREVR